MSAAAGGTGIVPCGSHTKSPSATRQRILSAAYARNPSVDKQVKSGIIVWILLGLPMLILAFMLRLVVWLLVHLIALSAYIAAAWNERRNRPAA